MNSPIFHKTCRFIACLGTALLMQSAGAQVLQLDLNNDSVADTLATDVPGEAVRVLSGADSSVLRLLSGSQAGEAFGSFAVLVPDLSGDGVPEVVVAAPSHAASGGVGATYAFSPVDGALLWVRAATPGEPFLANVAHIPDQDEDGVADLLVESDPPGTGTDYGLVVLLSGRTGARLAARQGGLAALTAWANNGGVLYTPSDIDDSGAVNTADFAAFLSWYSNEDLRADLNGDGVVDDDDLHIIVDDVIGGTITVQAMAVPPGATLPNIAPIAPEIGECDCDSSGFLPSACSVTIQGCPTGIVPRGTGAMLSLDTSVAGGIACWVAESGAMIIPSPDGMSATIWAMETGHISVRVRYTVTMPDGSTCVVCARCEFDAEPACVSGVQIDHCPEYVFTNDMGWIDMIIQGESYLGLSATGTPAGGVYRWELIMAEPADGYSGSPIRAWYDHGQHLFFLTSSIPGHVKFRVWYAADDCDPAFDDCEFDVLLPVNLDPDGDGLPSTRENSLGTDPACWDTDNDGFGDGVEVRLGGDPLNPLAGPNIVLDSDRDGLSDFEEFAVFHTDPHAADTDNDLVLDVTEVRLGLDPLRPRTSSAVLDRRASILLANDRDGDLIDDGTEMQLGWDPSSRDQDGDGLVDGWEVRFGLDPTQPEQGVNSSMSPVDSDADGLTDAVELLIGSNRHRADTDGDGVHDGIEAWVGLDPRRTHTTEAGADDGDMDYDFDGLSNAMEQLWGTDAVLRDTDADGTADGLEVYGTSDPLSDADSGCYNCVSDSVDLTVTLSHGHFWGYPAMTGTTTFRLQEYSISVAGASGYAQRRMRIPRERWLTWSVANPTGLTDYGQGYGTIMHLDWGPGTPGYVNTFGPTDVTSTGWGGPMQVQRYQCEGGFTATIDCRNRYYRELPPVPNILCSPDSPVGKLVLVDTTTNSSDGCPHFADFHTSDSAFSYTAIPILFHIPPTVVRSRTTISFSFPESPPYLVERNEPPIGVPWDVWARNQAGSGYRMWRHDDTDPQYPKPMPRQWPEDVWLNGNLYSANTAYPLQLLLDDLQDTLIVWIEAAGPSPTITGDVISATLSGLSCTASVRTTAVRLDIVDARHFNPSLQEGFIDTVNLNTPLTSHAPEWTVGGAITDGASLCIAWLTPDPQGNAFSLRMNASGNCGTNTRVYGGLRGIGQSSIYTSPIQIPDLPAKTPLSLAYRFTETVEFDSGRAWYLPPPVFADPYFPGPARFYCNPTTEYALYRAFLYFSLEYAGWPLVEHAGTRFVLTRPPVVLVHGILGHGDNDLPQPPRDSDWYWSPDIYRSGGLPLHTHVYRADYKATSTRGFSENYTIVPLTIRRAMDELHSGVFEGSNDQDLERYTPGLRYAATRADVIGHSQGGQLIRFYASNASGHCPRPPRGIPPLGDDWWPQMDFDRDPSGTSAGGNWFYERKSNLFAGDIRRAVTVGSVWRGSELANDGIKMFQPTTNGGRLLARDIFSAWLADENPDAAELVEASLPYDDVLGAYVTPELRPPTCHYDNAVGSRAYAILTGLLSEDVGEPPGLWSRANYPSGEKSILWAPIAGIKRPLGSLLSQVTLRNSVANAWSVGVDAEVQERLVEITTEHGSTVYDADAWRSRLCVLPGGDGRAAILLWARESLLYGDGAVSLESQLNDPNAEWPSLEYQSLVFPGHAHSFMRSGNNRIGSRDWRVGEPKVWTPECYSESIANRVLQLLSESEVVPYDSDFRRWDE